MRMMIINGLLFLTLLLIAGLVYIVLDNLRQAEIEAELELVRLARRNQHVNYAGDHGRWSDHRQDIAQIYSESREERINAGYPDQLAQGSFTTNEQGFFSIETSSSESLEPTLPAVEYWHLGHAA